MSKYIFGLLLVVLGALFLFNQAGIIEFNLIEIIKLYWPVIIILWGLKLTFSGLKQYFRRRGSGTLIFGSIVLIFGVSLQGSKLDYFTLAEIWPWIWPFFLIFLGILFLLRPKNPTFILTVDTDLFSESKRAKKSDYDADDSSYEYGGKVFKKSFVGSINFGQNPWEVGHSDFWIGIGDIDLDFSKALLKDGVNTVDLSGWVGDIKLYIPEELPVKILIDLKIGEVDMFNESSSGTNRSLQYVSPSYDHAENRLKLNISFLVGDVDIKRI